MATKMPKEEPLIHSVAESLTASFSGLFRHAALQTKNSSDRTDEPVRIVPPLTWLALVTVVSLLLCALIWGVFGRIPYTIEGIGILLRGGIMEGVVAPGEGQLLEFLVKTGDQISIGQKVATLHQPTLESQIANQSRTVEDYQMQFDEINTSSEKQLASQLDFNAKQRVSVQTSIESYRQQETSLQKVVDAQSKLLSEGLIPMTTLLQSQTQLDATRLNILQAESQMQQIETNDIQARTDARRSVDSARISLQQAEAQLLNLKSRLELIASVVAPRAGRVVGIDTAVGQNINAGTQVLTLERSSEPMQALLFFPSGKGKEIKPGMPLQIAPETVRTDRYGYMLGNVTRIGDVPATEGSMMSVLANEALVQAVSGGSTVLEVSGSLETDKSTDSGFRWSSSIGPPVGISSGTICKARAVTHDVRPIELVIPFLRKFFGIAD
jgi:HlyD family secretion protein